MKPLLPSSKASVFFDGIFAEPVRLAHPEGVAVHPDGSVWCGTENGDIIRIEADGSEMEAITSTGGFIAGIAFDDRDRLFACDIRFGQVFCLDIATRTMRVFGDRLIAVPNYPVVDLRRRALYVSDSHSFEEPGPGLVRFDLDTGASEIWSHQPLFFANGMALHPTDDELYVVESKRQRVVAFEIRADGSAGELRVVVENLSDFPDGIAFDEAGVLYIGCYEPSQIYRFHPDAGLQLLIRDPEATTIAHPTNLAFRGQEMFSSNLGRWHITRIDIGRTGSPVPRP